MGCYKGLWSGTVDLLTSSQLWFRRTTRDVSFIPTIALICMIPASLSRDVKIKIITEWSKAVGRLGNQKLNRL